MARRCPKALPATTISTCLQCSILDQQRGNGSLGFIQLCFDNRANDRAFGIGTDIGVISHQQDGLQQILDALFSVWPKPE